jgi:hypothetical protein
MIYPGELVHFEVCIEADRRSTISRKRHKPEEIVAKLCQVNVMVSQSQSLADAVRATGVMEVRPLRPPRLCSA